MGITKTLLPRPALLALQTAPLARALLTNALLATKEATTQTTSASRSALLATMETMNSTPALLASPTANPAMPNLV